MPSANAVFNTTHAGGNAQITNVNADVVHVIQNVYTMTPDQEHRVYKWLDAPDSSGNFLAAREKHHGQTGTWFIKGDIYTTWKETPDSALWVYGTPGCGKTVICSTIIEETQLRCSGNPAYACAYFFFDNRNAQTDQALHDKLIRSIIQQLCDQSKGVPSPLVEIYGSGRQQVSVASLQSALQKIIGGFERTYIIIDALDECTDGAKVLAWIKELMEWKSGKVSILFSSRPEHDITDIVRCMAYIVRVTLNSKLADKDIETFLDVMLSKMIKWNPELIARIRALLITGADGMFRWVALQIAELSKCRTPKAVEAQLRTLPKDLDGMYERALLDHPNQVELKQLLMWLAFSIRPLQLQELADVVTVDFPSNGLPSYDPNLKYFVPSDMLAACSTFVTVLDTRSRFAIMRDTRPSFVIELEGTAKLAHMSVKDYLLSDCLKNGAASYFCINTMLAHSMITKTCLAYVFHLRRFPSIDDFHFPLAHYAVEYWIDHMHSGGGEDEHLSQMLDCIFSLKESALANWVRLDNPDRFWWQSRYFAKPSAEIAATLYYACTYGLQRIAHQLLIGGAAVNAEGGRWGNALRAASYHGHDAVVRLLLEKGADMNAQGEEHGNALQAASEGGHSAIVRLLLENGADLHAQGGKHGHALQAASHEGHDGVVRLLLEKGADVNAQGGRYGNALQAASGESRVAIVQLLLEKGADVNAQGGPFGNALQAASCGGHDGIIRLLLEAGADVNTQGGYHGTALQAASARCYNHIIKLLLDHGADVNTKGGWYGSALKAAIESQCSTNQVRELVVKLLLQHGAIDEDSEVDESNSGEDRENINEEQDDEVAGRADIADSCRYLRFFGSAT